MCQRDKVEHVRLKEGDDSISVTSFATRLSNSNHIASSDDEGSLPQLWQRRQSRRDSTGIVTSHDDDDRNRMLFIKVILILVLLGAVVGMSVGAFQYVHSEEKSTFETEFQNIAREVISLASKNIRNKFETTQLLAASIASVVRASDTLVWPNVTIPNYGAKASLAWEATQAVSVVFAPIVQHDQRLSFEAYMRDHIYNNFQEMIDYQGLEVNASELAGVPDMIAALNISSGGKIPETRPGPYLVNWNYYPFNPNRFFTGNNLLALQTNRNAYASMMASRTASLSFAKLLDGVRGQIFQPIFESVESGKIVGVLWVTSLWANYFTGPREALGGLEVVLRSSCGFTSTFAVNSTGAVNLGLDDLHNYPQFDHLVVSDELFSIHANPDAETAVDDACLDTLTLDVYPTQELRDSYMTQEPYLYAGIILIIFAVTLLLFLVYDRMVNERQLKNRRRMQKQDRIVADIFPEQIVTRLYGDNEDEELEDSLDNTQYANCDVGSSNRLAGTIKKKRSKEPIADLYLESTIMYSDICGFTAWSSQREPPQVFTLLEHVFSEFDKLARRFGVFKVESIGDVFIAATGVPDHDPNHAVNMARFARKCIDRSSNLMKLLETKLGPDTADLEIRIGIHSGQVTAGVLRGDRARFQLFGETVNIAQQLLKHGRGKMVHISEATANHLKAAGKSRWAVARSSSVLGNLKNTYWLKSNPVLSKGRSSSLDMSASTSEPSQPFSMYQLEENDEEAEENDEDPTSSHQEEERPSDHFAADLSGGYEHASNLTKTQRLVEWNVQVLAEFLEQLMAARQIAAASTSAQSRTRSKRSLLVAEMSVGNCETVLDEFREIISLPDSTVNVLERQRIAQSTVLPASVKEKLHHLVASIASMYRANPFHNFEHASHVTASVVKMLKRITDTDVAAQKRTLSQIQKLDGDEELPTSSESHPGKEPMDAHSYGITSDPLTQFAVVFCSIIHDADHPGVTNAVLVKEDTYLSRRYKQKSVAEQNSVDLVWSLLNLPEYAELRSYIYSTEDELRRFRQITVNIVMATDICDRELGALRKNRWNVAFAEDAVRTGREMKSDMDRKATIVLEHLIQASDVSHTMQHWNIYLLWNEKLFREMHRAYKEGRMDSDPTEGWYKGEIGFFDFYIIPLAKKLESCGVFGVSSAEYLEYAEQNRKLWEERGEAIMAGYLERLKNYPDVDNSFDLEAFNEEGLAVAV